MGRLLIVLIFSTLALYASPASSQDAERRAGEMLAQAGASSFEGGDYEQALKQFEQALTVMYSGKIERASAQLLNYLGRSYAAVGRCKKALPILARAQSRDAPPIFERARYEAESTCLYEEARKTVKKKRCKESLRALRALDGRVQGEQERWRIQAIETCDPKPTSIPLSTPGAAAANTLIDAARKERRRHRYKRAMSLYKKALAVVDLPLIRLELGEVQLHRKICKEALDTLRPIQEVLMSTDLRTGLASCRRKLGLSTSPPLIAPKRLNMEGDEQGSAGTLWGWTAIGVGGGLSVLAGTFLILYVESSANYEAAYREAEAKLIASEPIGSHEEEAGIQWIEAQPEVQGPRTRATSYSSVAWVSLGLGAASLAVGITLLVLAQSKDGGEDVALTPLIAPGQIGLLARF